MEPREKSVLTYFLLNPGFSVYYGLPKINAYLLFERDEIAVGTTRIICVTAKYWKRTKKICVRAFASFFNHFTQQSFHFFRQGGYLIPFGLLWNILNFCWLGFPLLKGMKTLVQKGHVLTL